MKQKKVGTLDKFLLLFWKNWLLQKRHTVQSVFEILIPVFFAAILVIVRAVSNYDNYATATLYPAFTVDKLPSSLSQVTSLNNDIKYGTGYDTGQKIHSNTTLMWTPGNYATGIIMNNVGKKLGIEVHGFANESAMVTYIMSQTLPTNVHNILGGVVFMDTFSDKKTIFPKHITYKIRLQGDRKTESQYPMFQPPGPRNRDDVHGGDPGYYETGFLAIQYATDMAITEYMSQKPLPDITVELQRYPYPPFIDDFFLAALEGWLPVVVMMSFLYPSMNIVKGIVHEKEKRLKESMKIMGLPGWLHWAAWFCKCFSFLLINSLLMTVILEIHWYEDKNLAVLSKSNPFVVMLFFCIYCVSLTSFSFLISVFFSRANSGAIGGGVIFFLFFSPYYYVQPRYDTLSETTKYLTSLLSNTAMSYGSICISKFEAIGSGIQWSNVNERVSPEDSFTLLDILLMMILDAVIYLILALYLEAVFPGEFGVPQPWYFPFTKSYWCGAAKGELVFKVAPHTCHKKPHLFEEEPYSLPAGIQIQNLSKEFGKNIAVNNINLNMYEGQITALLGHNGAGKTTTMSLLTGLFPPSKGTAMINGFDIRTHVAQVRTSLGLCPQHDVLFDELTVQEHLYFFCMMKGRTGKQGQEEINRMIKRLGLEDKRHTKSSALSGGMKRKLSVGIALCADSKVVLLDEPTSGMDPGARRFTWDLLQEEKKGRTILLTTHFMEEADLLGDRIAVMASGELQCCGSSLFLKKKFGAGYHLVLVKTPDCDVETITNQLKKYVPTIEVEQDVGAELSYVLPHEKLHLFETMFQELEDNKENLGISSYGASITTMEEVFMRVCHDAEMQKDTDDTSNEESIGLDHAGTEQVGDGMSSHPDEDIIHLSSSRYTLTSHDGGTMKLNTGLKLHLQQFRAMLQKKLLYHVRTWFLTLLLILIPTLFLVIGLVILHSMPGVHDAPPLTISLDNYNEPVTMTELVFPTNSLAENTSHAYINNLKQHLDEHLAVEENMTSYILDLEKKDMSKVTLHYVVAGTFQATDDDKMILTALFNNQPFHSPPLTLNLMDNAILRVMTNSANATITVINHPLPYDDTSKIKENNQMQSTGFQVGFNVTYGMSFLVSILIIFLIKERVSNAKHLQFVSGVNLFIFWVSNMLIDFVICLLSAVFVMLTLVAFDEKEYNNVQQQGRIFLLMILYTWAITPMMYLFSFAYTIPATGFAKMTFFNIFSGLATMVTVMILKIPKLDLKYVADILDWVFMLLPNYNLGTSLYQLYDNYVMNELCTPQLVHACILAPAFPNMSFPCCKDYGHCGNMECPEWNRDYLTGKAGGIGRNLVYLTCEGILFLLILFCIEIKVHNRIASAMWEMSHKLKKVPNLLDAHGTLLTGRATSLDISVNDDDVMTEESRIQKSPLAKLFATDTLVVKNLAKYYGDFLAVKNLSFGVKSGECFGLLGVNGAGKTTTFKMLTGDLNITSGEAFLHSYSIKSDLKKVQQNLGYCPQFDAVILELTGREILRMFGRLRGVPENKIDATINKLADDLLIMPHIDKKVEVYSGGNKRKLSVAVALIGDPPMLFLDEPTTGMDPVARRHLWDVISARREQGKSIILTSHSMEECEALCTRLTIMVNGEFRCLGSPQHLKTKFAEGYTLIAKIKSQISDTDDEQSPELQSSLMSRSEMDLRRLRDFIDTTFQDCILKDIHQGMVHYHINDRRMSWAKIFGIMEAAKTDYNIEDYSVGQTTLEQVFLNFTKYQVADE